MQMRICVSLVCCCLCLSGCGPSETPVTVTEPILVESMEEPVEIVEGVAPVASQSAETEIHRLGEFDDERPFDPARAQELVEQIQRLLVLGEEKEYGRMTFCVGQAYFQVASRTSVEVEATGACIIVTWGKETWMFPVWAFNFARIDHD